MMIIMKCWSQATNEGYECHSGIGTDEYRIDPGFQRSCQGYERLAEKFCRTYAGRLTDQYPGTFYQAIVPMYATVW